MLRDAARWIVASVEAGRIGTFNVGGHVGMTIGEALETCRSISGARDASFVWVRRARTPANVVTTEIVLVFHATRRPSARCDLHDVEGGKEASMTAARAGGNKALMREMVRIRDGRSFQCGCCGRL